MVWCARQAAHDPTRFRSENSTQGNIERVSLSLAGSELPQYIRTDPDWAWVCCRTLLETDRAFQVEVPFAAVDEREGQNQGLVGQFCVELLSETGSDRVALHPGQVFALEADQDLLNSLREAWSAACSWDKQNGSRECWDARYRIALPPQRGSQIRGRSASGAALLAFSLARRRKVPDAGVIVVAQVHEDGSGRLLGVNEEGVRANGLEHLLGRNFALRHACSTPLLLTFACLLSEAQSITEATTRISLYSLMLEKILSGQWRNVRPSWADKPIRLEQCKKLLKPLGWRLFQAAPARNRFTLEEWEKAASGLAAPPGRRRVF